MNILTNINYFLATKVPTGINVVLTESAVVKITINDILWNMEKKLITGLVAVDLSAAFDTRPSSPTECVTGQILE